MRKILFILILLSLQTVFSQYKKKEQEYRIVNHSVTLGETIRMISRKYLVEPSEIYRLNKYAIGGISSGMILQIPVPVKRSESFIGKKEIKQSKANFNQEKEIEEQSISTSMVTESVKDIIQQEEKIFDFDNFSRHKVKLNQTLLSISKQYDIPIAVLKEANKEIGGGSLKMGEILKIPSVKLEPKSDYSVETSVEERVSAVENDVNRIIAHKVLVKETLMSLAKKYNVSVEEIKNQNFETLKKGLQVGQVLKIQLK